MKHFILSCALSMAAIATSSAQQTGQLPVYLDNTKPVEQRIDDAIARMTLQEKIGSPVKVCGLGIDLH